VAVTDTEVVIKGAELTLITVSGHGVATVLYVAECHTCHASTDRSEDEVRPVAVWAVQHTREKPNPTRRKEHTETPELPPLDTYKPYGNLTGDAGKELESALRAHYEKGVAMNTLAEKIHCAPATIRRLLVTNGTPSANAATTTDAPPVARRYVRRTPHAGRQETRREA